MRAEILTVGTELLLGDIVNTNAQFLAQQLANLGIEVYHQAVVGDNKARLLKALEEAFSRADFVVTTGGLGPTADDLTKEVAAEFFGLDLALDEPSFKTMEQRFAKMGVEMTPNNKKQAMMPIGCTILQNPNGTAPGCYWEKDGKQIALLPGPPFEMKPMFENELRPILENQQEFVFVSKEVRLNGIGESAAEDKISDLLAVQTNPTIAPYAKQFEVVLRVTAKATSPLHAEKLLMPTIDSLYSRLGEYIYAVGETSLAEVVVELLIKQNLTIACAESCTGGLLTSALVDVAGASSVLLEGVVTYSNQAKQNRLGVLPETLLEFGAVSEQTAMQMAMGVAKTSGASIGIATTGVAGPDGGTNEKPVGLIYIALCANGKTEVTKLNLVGDRNRIRNRTVRTALGLLWNLLKNS